MGSFSIRSAGDMGEALFPKSLKSRESCHGVGMNRIVARRVTAGVTVTANNTIK